MHPSVLEVSATALFALGVCHTFVAGRFNALAHRFREGSIAENVCHFLGEVEAVFMLWACAFMGIYTVVASHHDAVHYFEKLNFTEPLFVFVIMTMAATKPVVDTAEWLMERLAGLLPLSKATAFVGTALVVGPLLGSLITEPAAMTVTAMLLKRRLFDWQPRRTLMYAAVGTLFVNVSIGGTLTNYAAPPILMIKEAFGWSSMDVLRMLGWKAAFAVMASSATFCVVFLRDLRQLGNQQAHADTGAAPSRSPWWMATAHLLWLGFVVMHSHHAPVFMAALVFFLGFAHVTREYQRPLELRSALMVAGFLGGLVTLGTLQTWWLQPLLASMGDLALYFGATGLTAITDNAALTYLGSRVELSEGMQYALVAGAVTGGGLTVIANAPNPAGNAILAKSFGEQGISPLGLLLGALWPTVVAILCFLFLPSL